MCVHAAALILYHEYMDPQEPVFYDQKYPVSHRTGEELKQFLCINGCFDLASGVLNDNESLTH
jgi:hypothetical protein